MRENLIKDIKKYEFLNWNIQNLTVSLKFVSFRNLWNILLLFAEPRLFIWQSYASTNYLSINYTGRITKWLNTWMHCTFKLLTKHFNYILSVYKNNYESICCRLCFVVTFFKVYMDCSASLSWLVKKSMCSK